MPIEPGELDRLTGQTWTSSIPPVCRHCGYNLTGAVTRVCPECGGVFRMKDLRSDALESRMKLEEARRADAAAKAGLKVVCVGVAFVVVGIFLGGYGSRMLGRIGGVLCGFVGVFLGLSVFRAAQLPDSLREEFEVSPNRTLAAVVIVLGVGLAALSFIGW